MLFDHDAYEAFVNADAITIEGDIEGLVESYEHGFEQMGWEQLEARARFMLDTFCMHPNGHIQYGFRPYEGR